MGELSGAARMSSRMSALPPIADIWIAIPYQPLINVCFTPNSGRSTGYRRMSAFDPKRTLRVMLDVGESNRQPRTNWFVSPRCGSVLFRK
jgi:hypothetical protein